jgi:hypothetical protein
VRQRSNPAAFATGLFFHSSTDLYIKDTMLIKIAVLTAAKRHRHAITRDDNGNLARITSSSGRYIGFTHDMAFPRRRG